MVAPVTLRRAEAPLPPNVLAPNVEANNQAHPHHLRIVQRTDSRDTTELIWQLVGRGTSRTGHVTARPGSGNWGTSHHVPRPSNPSNGLDGLDDCCLHGPSIPSVMPALSIHQASQTASSILHPMDHPIPHPFHHHPGARPTISVDARSPTCPTCPATCRRPNAGFRWCNRLAQ